MGNKVPWKIGIHFFNIMTTHLTACILNSHHFASHEMEGPSQCPISTLPQSLRQKTQKSRVQDQSSVTPLSRGAKAPKTLVLQCFGAIRAGADDP